MYYKYKVDEVCIINEASRGSNDLYKSTVKVNVDVSNMK